VAIGLGVSIEGQKFTPGDEATPQQVLELAHEYRRAADVLLPTGRRRKPLSRAPYRLLAIQAIELYLNTLLLLGDHAPANLRGMRHDLGQRAKLAPAADLKLKKRTARHLRTLSESREYLVTRYGPEMNGTISQLNRLAATLGEVSEKVTTAVIRKRG